MVLNCIAQSSPEPPLLWFPTNKPGSSSSVSRKTCRLDPKTVCVSIGTMCIHSHRASFFSIRIPLWRLLHKVITGCMCFFHKAYLSIIAGCNLLFFSTDLFSKWWQEWNMPLINSLLTESSVLQWTYFHQCHLLNQTNFMEIYLYTWYDGMATSCRPWKPCRPRILDRKAVHGSRDSISLYISTWSLLGIYQCSPRVSHDPKLWCIYPFAQEIIVLWVTPGKGGSGVLCISEKIMTKTQPEPYTHTISCTFPS